MSEHECAYCGDWLGNSQSHICNRCERRKKAIGAPSTCETARIDLAEYADDAPRGAYIEVIKWPKQRGIDIRICHDPNQPEQRIELSDDEYSALANLLHVLNVESPVIYNPYV